MVAKKAPPFPPSSSQPSFFFCSQTVLGFKQLHGLLDQAIALQEKLKQKKQYFDLFS